MSRIDELIAELCPEGVEYKAIGDFGELVRGNGMPKSDFVESGVGCIHYGQIYTYYGIWTIETISFVSAAKAEKFAKVDPGDLIITNTSENLDDVCKAVAWLGDTQIVTGGHATVLKHDQDPKYLSYYLQTPNFFVEKKRHATGTKVIDVSAKSLAKIKIPVPPLEVQREIVKVLDTFTKLEAELEAELEARRRQYKYYRDALLSFDERMSGASKQASKQALWATLNEVATFKYGFTAKAANAGEFRFIRITDITDGGKLSPDDAKYVNSTEGASDYLVQRGDVLMARTGATFGKTVLIADDMPAVYASFLIRIRLDETEILPNYYWHFAQSSLYWQQANSLVSMGGQPQFNANVLKDIRLPIPSMEEQERIVAILNKFDALVNDLSSGLPAEIKARRQQYAHYRDRLLTFKEAA
ncbi:restriction endonuclease subunit S [Verminephrobacter eiseniae]|uniref:restriction endonuclease subunit S n=1 Tax=Verminephrobacter eiseniae TaxID=364317 RepID=UPI0022374A34|nr:restriction endonuclease subunit S [Verminephrobacter eiseniae]MCW5232452.1 restriction endonuclease subunit S [Verminephrobacter eiseniae]MCW5295982.1 restriction endonuclease subunit S [Verminephrobacter eiseniae]MCW8183973.1 restriction endonuclease subunit S [Verminephrobacter eiseniae]MCW8221633.1 restriction endonuclease subunit S [Verminephrobacter eiseniae]MCW8232672.1 restriction endonuclease subunit S [Verminephrobacter eiseniae]